MSISLMSPGAAGAFCCRVWLESCDCPVDTCWAQYVWIILAHYITCIRHSAAMTMAGLMNSSYARFRWILTMILPFGINLGINFGMVTGDEVGVFKEPVSG